MNISYELWPIWCDYLEEQGQNTELLRYVMIWNCFGQVTFLIDLNFRDNTGIKFPYVRSYTYRMLSSLKNDFGYYPYGISDNYGVSGLWLPEYYY